MKKVLVIIVVALALIIGGGRLGIHIMSRNLAQRVTVNNVEIANLADGEYTGTFTENPLVVEVKVYIENGRITDIEILKHEHGMGQKGEKIVLDVMEKQTLEVDTISGATASSKVILKAIEDALTKAK